MPTYRIIKQLPVALVFRNDASLLVRSFEGLYGGWSLVAQKVPSTQYSAVVLCRGTNQAQFEDTLAKGFNVQDGGIEERILDALIRVGYAERVPPPQV